MPGRRNERTIAFVLVLVLALIALVVIAVKAEVLGWSAAVGG